MQTRALLLILWIGSQYSICNSFQYSSTPYNSARNNLRARLRSGRPLRRKTAWQRTRTLQNLIRNDEYEISTLSEDPKCFLINNFLSLEECEAYISLADNSDEMNRSNAPEVSLSISRLWPLPFLCLIAGIPPVIRMYDETPSPSTISLSQIAAQALPNIAISLGLIIILSILVTQAVRMYAESSTRTSESAALNKDEDCDFIRNLVERASSITGHDWSRWEAPVITKYSPGALFASHNDASPTKGSEWIELGGQRVVTLIAYLNTCETGGGTKFDKLDFTVQPKQGSAVVFFPANADTKEADERTIHQSLPAVEEKYIVQLFGRLNRVPSPLGIPNSYKS